MNQKQARKSRSLEKKHQKMAEKTKKEIDRIVATKLAEAMARKEGEAMNATLTYLKHMPMWKKCQFFIELLWWKEVIALAAISLFTGMGVAGLVNYL